MARRRRLDLELVRLALVPSREVARREILAGHVLVGGSIADKPSRQVDPSQAIRILGDGPEFVSRAGGKLAAALAAFGVDPEGWNCLDAGSSTGGFTDCLLQRGASRVAAVDVGTNQLHESLKRDPRVLSREQTDIRRVASEELGGPFDLIVGDLSFISLSRVLPALAAMARPETAMILLIKPQFEAGRQEVSRGSGIITDPAIWARVISEVSQAADMVGAPMTDVSPSPVRGTAGNTEFTARFDVGGVRPDTLDATISAMIAGLHQ